jgi:outer membrane protein assembly factor BamD
MRVRSSVFAALVILTACSSGSKETRKDEVIPAKSEADHGSEVQSPTLDEQPAAGDHLRSGPTLHGMEGRPQEGFEVSAELNLQRAQSALKDHNYDEATKFFDYVRTRYPFQDASKVAELGLADTDFEKQEWDAARDRYQNFVKAHPTNAQADYAAYRAALTYWKDAPSDFVLLPPQYEKDLTPVKNALTAMRAFTRDWPQSKYVPEAKKVIGESETILARQDMYVSDFYAKREHYQGAANRLELLVKDYDQSELVNEALFKLHDLYGKLKEPQKAKDALRRIVERAPGSKEAQEAQKLLGS